MKPHRYHGFDFLRGLCAIGIALHHLLFWHGIGDLHNIGTYGVYVFFIISGASMTVAYADKMQEIPYWAFIARRYARLAPLYWLVLFSRNPFGQHANDLLLNMSMFFGFANPNLTSMVATGWSLGIEFVFYFTFPLFLALSASRWRWYWFFLAFIMQITFVHGLIHTHDDFLIKRGEFGQFIAFIAYFLAGCIIGRSINCNWHLSAPLTWVVFSGLLGILIITCAYTDYPVLGNSIGMAIAIGCMALVFIAGKLKFTSKIAWIANQCGLMSYGVYLLHARLFAWLFPFLVILPNYMSVTVVIMLTIFLALLIEKYFERPIKEWGYKSIS